MAGVGPLLGCLALADEVAATAPKRFAALFMGCGVNPSHWWAKGSGASMELGPCLDPLEPLKDKINVVHGLYNQHALGVGIHPGQTGNILSGAALKKGAELKGGVSIDQELARHLGAQDRPAEHGPRVRAADHRLPRDELLDGV